MKHVWTIFRAMPHKEKISFLSARKTHRLRTRHLRILQVDLDQLRLRHNVIRERLAGRERILAKGNVG